MSGTTALPFYLYDHLNEGPLASGTIGALQAACYAGTCLLSAGVLRRSKRFLPWALTGGTIFTLCYSIAPLFPATWFAAATTIGSMVGMALVWPAFQAYVGSEPASGLRHRRMALYNFSWSAGLAVGALLGGPLYDLHYLLPFAALFLMGVTAIGLLLSLPREAEHAPAESSEESRLAEGGRAQSIQTYLYAAWVANFVAFGALNVVRAVFPKRIDEVVASGSLTLFTAPVPAGWQAATVFSVMPFVLCLVSAVLMPWFGLRRFWRNRFWPVVLSQIATAGSLWVLGTTHSLALMVLSAMVIGVNSALCFIVSQHWSIADPALKHRRAAVHEGANGLGGFTWALGYGIAAQALGTSWPFQASIVWGVALVLLQLALIARGRRLAAQQPSVAASASASLQG